MKIYCFDVGDGDADHAIIAESEEEALEIYFKQFPPFVGELAIWNKEVVIYAVREIEKGFVHSAYGRNW